VCPLLRCYGKTCCTFSLAHAAAVVDPPPSLSLSVISFFFPFHPAHSTLA